MKADLPRRHAGCPRWRADERGVALIIVLSFIVLCTILVVAFFASVTTEGAGQRAAVSETSAMTLAASAVQLMEGTITTATEPTTDTTFAWASQPGMIRTYGTGTTASSDPLAYYKLYSSNNMIVSGKLACNAFTGPGTTSLAAEVPQYWDKAPPLYTDLNAPLLKATSTGTTPIFPIMDPRAADPDVKVEGFSWITPTSGLDGLTVADPSKLTTYSGDSGARVPMPVRWLYVLADGTLTAPDGPTLPTATVNNIATWSNAMTPANIPKATNPIVGRVAFWTDDESAKVNVNTAGEGTYWDTPIANAASAPVAVPITSAQTVANPVPDYLQQPVGDVALAVLQPARNEFQRYPGHPATTCLSSVFGKAMGTYNAQNRAQFVQAFTDTAPRLKDVLNFSSSSGSSSMGGSQIPLPGPGTTPVPLTLDQKRLYASLDEYQYSTDRVTTPTDSRKVQALGTTSDTTVLQNEVNTCRFFLTAHSKAPELNLFGLPRVAMWPVWDDADAFKRTNFENEMVRCSTIAPATDAHQMIFQRANAADSSYDWSSLKRNRLVYGYLQTLLNRPVPGFGGTFSTQYSAQDSDQILTEIFDYIRCTNLADNSITNNQAATSYTGTMIGNAGSQGQVVPITVTSTDGNTTHGLGRIATIGELSFLLMKIDDRNNTTNEEVTHDKTGTVITGTNLATNITVSGAAPAIPNGTVVDPTKTTLIEWALIPKLVSPMDGSVALANNIRLHFSVVNLKIGGVSVGGPYSDVYSTGSVSGWRDCVFGGIIGFTSLIEDFSNKSAYPTGMVTVPGTSAGLGLTGAHSTTVSGTVEVQVFAPSTALITGTPLQTFEFDFGTKTSPAANGNPTPVPIPEVWYNVKTTTTAPPPPAQPVTTTTAAWYGGMRSSSGNYAGGANATFTFPTNNWTKNGTRLNGTLYTYTGSPDTVRSVVPTGLMPASSTVSVAGDMRITALTQNDVAGGKLNPIPATTFGLANARVSGNALPPTDTATYPNLHGASSLRSGLLFREAGWSQGMLQAGISAGSYYANNAPEVPVLWDSVNKKEIAAPFPGDWDNGMGLIPDGPYANKPDEGLQPLGSASSRVPYVGDYQIFSSQGSQSPTFFSPNRQVSSPVMFGSLPAGMSQPWRTLLFRPANLLSTTTPHPGGGPVGALAGTIRDHLLLDLFWMPIVEPYGISEPFATSGKINLNTQIVPFTYVTRTTGLRAVLKSVMITALNPNQIADNSNGKLIGNYKLPSLGSTQGNPHENQKAVTRYPIDPDGTINQLTLAGDSVAANAYPEFNRTTHTAALPNFFVSASQICDVPLIPQNVATNQPPTRVTATQVQNFWSTYNLTGDNSMERPYSMIYPRVTTKSNIFTVHVHAQTLKKNVSDTNQARWQEGKDQVLSDYRGSFTIEKYFDPNAGDITSDAAGTTPVTATSDDSMPTSAALRGTKWRLLNTKRFGQ